MAIKSLAQAETYEGALATMYFPYGSHSSIKWIERIVRYGHGGIKEVHAVIADEVNGVRVPRTGEHAGRNVFRMNRRGELRLVDENGRIGRDWYTPELRLNVAVDTPYWD